MPIYEYQCQQCGQPTEVMQKINDPELKKCPHCGKDSLEKIMSHTSFQLKGGGYYATDYKKPAAPETNPEKKVEAPAAKPDTKTETDK